MITLRGAELYRVDLPLVCPFRTSFGEQTERNAVLVRVEADVDGSSQVGWGECTAMVSPLYSSEYGAGAWSVLRDFLVPLVARAPLHSVEDVAACLAPVKGHRMAKAALEVALTDAACRASGVSLSKHLGGIKDRISCGVSVGIAASNDALIEEIRGYVDAGYRRVKLKIEPGRDVSILAVVHDEFPSIPLTADANAAYSLSDLETFRHIDRFGLQMIEQPLPADRLGDHAILAGKIETPVCLDETITSAAVAADAIALGACSIINVKVGRMGGLEECRRLHDLALGSGVPLWCGGMLETGIGRATNLALASMEGFTLPGDTSASNRYFAADITEPFVLSPDGTMPVPAGPGLGVEPNPSQLEALTGLREKIV